MSKNKGCYCICCGRLKGRTDVAFFRITTKTGKHIWKCEDCITADDLTAVYHNGGRL